MDNFNSGSNAAVAASDTENSEEISDEDRVNKYFYKLYMSQLTTDQMVEIMRSLSSSPRGSRDQGIYTSMLRILFNECRFFPKYPVKELAITAELFGKMVKHGLLLTNVGLLQLALRCVLEALRRGKTSKMFQFGTIALSQLEYSIASYPWFAVELLTIPEVRETFPRLYKTCEKFSSIMAESLRRALYVDQAMGITIEPPDDTETTSAAANGAKTSSGTGGGGLHSAHGSDVVMGHLLPSANEERDVLALGELESLMTCVGDEYNLVPPNDAVANYIFAAFNNMCMETVAQKALEVRQMLVPENKSWLLLYITKTRASKEPNLHNVFVYFCENLKFPKLFDLAIQITYSCIAACLTNLAELKELPAYRTLLKNLGTWLGKITLARNVPIVSRHLDIKQMLVSAYENGALVAILPLITKAMEGIQRSRIFRPPNPWTSAILAVLAEIHMLPRLKASLVFEVEVFFKHVNLDIGQYIHKSTLFQTKVRPLDSADFDSETSASSVKPAVLGEVASGLFASTAGETSQEPAKTVEDAAEAGRLRSRQMLGKVVSTEKDSNVLRNGLFGTPTTFGSDFHVQNLAEERQHHQLQQRGPMQMQRQALQHQLQQRTRFPYTGSEIERQTHIDSSLSGPSSVFITRTATEGDLSSRGREDSYGGAGVGGLGDITPAHPASCSSRLTTLGELQLLNLRNSIVISSSIALFNLQPHLRSLVPISIERAVLRILPIVSDHVISISRATTRALIQKDFDSEQDEATIVMATRYMFVHWTTTLVLATSREPLRLAFTDGIRAVLQTHRTHDANDHILVEQLIQVLCQDNLPQAVAVCEKIIDERAQVEADVLAQDIIKFMRARPHKPLYNLPAALKNHNAKLLQQPRANLMCYKSIFFPASNACANLAPGFGNKDPVVVADQQKQQHPSVQLNNANVVSDPYATPTSATSALVDSGAVGISSETARIISCFEERFAKLKEPLREIALFPPVLYTMHPQEADYEPIMFSTHALLILYSLPVDHVLFQTITCCISLLETCPLKGSAATAIAQRLLLFLSDGVGYHAGLNVEILLCVLEELSRLNPHVKQTLSSLVFSLPLEPSNGIFNVVTVTGLLRYHLLDWGHLTHYLCMAMDKGRNTFAVEMAIAVVAIALIDQQSAPPEYGSTLIREIAGVACGSEVCKTYPGVLLKDARAKLLRDFMELQNPGKPLVTNLTTILRKNRSVILSFGDLKSTNVNRLRKIGIGGVRRVPPPPATSESHKAIVAIIFAKWVESAMSYQGESLVIAWRHFYRRFNLASLFKMDGGADNFFGICVVCAMASLNVNGHRQGPATGHVGDLLAGGNSTAGTFRDDTGNRCVDSRMSLAKMADVMMRLSGPGDCVPTAPLQKLLFAIVCLAVYEEHMASCYKLWVGLMDYFDRYELGVLVGGPTGARASVQLPTAPTRGTVSMTMDAPPMGNMCQVPIELLTPLGGHQRHLTTGRTVDSHVVASDMGTVTAAGMGQVTLAKDNSDSGDFGAAAQNYGKPMGIPAIGPNHVTLCKITFLHALQCLNPIRAPRFAKYWFMLLGSKSVLNCCANMRCWPALAKLFWLGGLYVDAIATADVADAYTRLILYVARSWPLFVQEHYWVFGSNFVIERIVLATHTIPNLPNVLQPNFSLDAVSRLVKSAPKLPNSILFYCGNFGLEVLMDQLLIAMHKSGRPCLVNTAFSAELVKVVDLLTKHAEMQDSQLLMLMQSMVLHIGLTQVNTLTGFFKVVTGDNVNGDVAGEATSGVHEQLGGDSPTQASDATTTNVPGADDILTHTNGRLYAILHILRRLSAHTKYLLIRAICRQLRYPNAHTLLFACIILWLYDECNTPKDELNRSVILRVLLETFVAPYTCPWGVKFVVVELFKNPRYGVLASTSTASPKIKALIEAVAAVCA